MTEYEEYKQTGMLGSYQPERTLLRETDDGVQPVFRDTTYHYDEDAVIVERDMIPGQPTTTATKKLLVCIDSSIEKEKR